MLTKHLSLSLSHTQLASAKVQQLKDFLKSVGQKMSGKKDELVARVEAYLSSQM